MKRSLGIALAVVLAAGCSSSTVEGTSDAGVDGASRPDPARPDADSGIADADEPWDGPARPPEDAAPPESVDGPELAPCSNGAGFLGAKYLDLTAPDAFRRVEWNNKSVPADRAFQLSKYRCVKVKVGQTFQWDWDGENDLVTFHVLVPNGGDSPSFVDTANHGRTKIVATFDTAGTFGYTCRPHPTAMSGVVWVVP